jgi:hypothetical protein
MKPKPHKLKPHKGTLEAGGNVYPGEQLEEVFAAMWDEKPLPRPRFRNQPPHERKP